MTQEQATSAYESAQLAIFLATAHPYLEPSFLDVAQADERECSAAGAQRRVVSGGRAPVGG
jgi:hypothetical protein